MRDTPKFTEKTKSILAKMSGERCSICEEQTSLPNKERTGFVNKGEAAHIFGANEAPNNRYNPSLSNDELKHISNGIWVCNNCHKHIDSDDCDYTIDKLLQIKENHFLRVCNGKYGKTNINSLNELNYNLNLLENTIKDKEKIISKNELIYNLEINKLKVAKEKLEKERNDIISQYESILNSTKNINNELIEKILQLAFIDNDLNSALQLLDEKDLNSDEFILAKKRVLKAEIYFLRKDWNNAFINYKKAFEISKDYQIASFYIRFLEQTGDTQTLIYVTQIVLEDNTSLKEREKLILNGILGIAYKKIDTKLSVLYFKKCLEIVEMFASDSDYLLLKAGYTNYLAKAYLNNADNIKALQSCEDALGIFMTGSVQSDNINDCWCEFVSLYHTIAQAYKLNSNVEESVKYYLLALKVCNEQIPDRIDIKATTILNMSNLLIFFEFKKGLVLLNESIDLFNKLMEKHPLKYIGEFISSYCKKSDFLFQKGYLLEAIKELEIAESILESIYEINTKKIYSIDIEIKIRKSVLYSKQNQNTLSLHTINEVIDSFKNANFDNEEMNTKIAALILFKSQLHSDNQTKKADYIYAKKILEKYANNYNANKLLLMKIEEELSNIN